MHYVEQLVIFIFGIIAGVIIGAGLGDCAKAQTPTSAHCLLYESREVQRLCQDLDLHKNEFAVYVSKHLNDNAHGEIRPRGN
jgi:hypothetical protein